MVYFLFLYIMENQNSHISNVVNAYVADALVPCITSATNKFIPRTNNSGGSKNPQKLSDKELFKLCREFGSNALRWRRKFAGLLPEVFKRRLYEKKGFSSIFEFAAKLAGMSQEQVRRVLNIEKKLEDKPALRELLINGDVSVNKLARVVSIATIENQNDLAGLSKNLSQNALETFVKDEKQALENSGKNSENLLQQTIEFENRNGLLEPENAHESVRAHTNPQSILPYVKILEQLSPQIKEKLLILLEKGIDLNELIAQMLQNREAEIAAAKHAIVAEMEVKEAEQKANANKKKNEQKNVDNQPKSAAKKPSRYIPVKIKKIIKLEQGDKCSFPGCKNLEENMHHTQRFALTQNHNPFFLAQSCKSHHEIAHTVDVKYQEKRRRTDG